MPARSHPPIGGRPSAPSDRADGSLMVRAVRRAAIVAPLAGAAGLVIAARQVSDIGAVRDAELSHGRPFEYPALARLLYLAERAVSGSIAGISVVNVAAMAVAAVVLLRVLQKMGVDADIWATAPLLVLAGQNWDTFTALTMVLAISAWYRGEDVKAGLWIGVGTAFKIVPAVLLIPLLAARGWRRSRPSFVAAAAVVLVVNVPLALRNPSAWLFPYRFAAARTDVRGTVWAAVGVHGTVLAVASLAALGVLLAVVFLLARRGAVSFPGACVLAVAAFIASNKVWQPHYVLWLIPLVAIAGVRRSALRALEWASLAWFVALWRHAPSVHAGAFSWSVGSVRMACLLVLVVTVLVDTGQFVSLYLP